MQGPADRPLLTPAALLGDRIAPLPERSVLVYDEAHVPRRRRRKDPSPFRQVALAGDGAVAVVAAIGPGAPTAAVTAEFLAHLGVRALVSVGIAGDLVGDRSCPTVFSVSTAVSAEATSVRYGAPPMADPALVAALARVSDHQPVASVTTDTPLRHTAQDISEFRRSADVIEMELAALFAASRVCGMACGALVVTSDSYNRAGWRQGDPDLVRPAVDGAIAEAVDVLNRFDVDPLPQGNGGRR